MKYNITMKAYAGIGSRETPSDIQLIMSQAAMKLAQLGWILRSGGAEGADTAFAQGLINYNTLCKYQEIYLPWNNFEGLHEDESKGIYLLNNPMAKTIAKQFHPAYEKLGRNGRKLIGRNGYQVLGKELNDPVKFILCWTPDGAITTTTSKTGGTGHAIRIAYSYNIPVYNLKIKGHLVKIQEWLDVA